MIKKNLPLRPLYVAMAAVTVAASGMLLTSTDADPDLWGHIQFGKDVLRYGLPATTTYSYTADGYRWINHENLSEILYAWLWTRIGVSGLQAGKTLLGVLVIGSILWRAWKATEDMFASCVLSLIVAVNLLCHWSLRPQLLSLVFHTLLLAIMSYALPGDVEHWRPEAFSIRARQRLKWLWATVPLFFVWANSHGGFLAGYAIFLVYVLGRALSRWALPGDPPREDLSRLAWIVCASGLATLVNPYSLHLQQWLFSALSVPRPEITEWHGLSMGDPQTWLFAVLILAWLASLWCDRRALDRTHALIMLATGYEACCHRRHIAFFALQFGWWYVLALKRAMDRLRGAGADIPFGADLEPLSRRGAVMALSIATLVCGYGMSQRVSQVLVPRATYPISAVEFMAAHRLTGKTVVTFNWAQYVLAALGSRDATQPGTQVAFDGRFRTCYPQQLLDMHFDFILGDIPGRRYRSPESPPVDGQRTLRFAHPDLVLIDRKQQHSTDVMRQARPEWVLLYEDSVAELWGRSERYDRPDSPYYLAPDRRQLAGAPQRGAVAWPAFPVSRGHHGRADEF